MLIFPARQQHHIPSSAPARQRRAGIAPAHRLTRAAELYYFRVLFQCHNSIRNTVILRYDIVMFSHEINISDGIK